MRRRADDVSAQIALQLAFSGLSVGSIYALVALAIVIPFKASRRPQLRAGRDGDARRLHRRWC